MALLNFMFPGSYTIIDNIGYSKQKPDTAI